MAIGLTPDQFGREPHAVFVKILQDAGGPLTAKKIIDVVAGLGITRSQVSAEWAKFQKGVVRFHPNIHLPGRGLYEWQAEPETAITAARVRQFKLDALHAVAELAGEVEELAYDTGDADMIVERLRARVKAAALEQFGRPGDGATFDPGRHDMMGERPADGAAVTVLRPGYAWQENGSPLVLRKALVVAE